MSALTQISRLAEVENITITALEKKIGASKGVLSRAINNGSDIQTKWVELIVENYPQYNATWILTGKGDMLNNVAPVGSPPPASTGRLDLDSLYEVLSAIANTNHINTKNAETLTETNLINSKNVDLGMKNLESLLSITLTYSELLKRAFLLLEKHGVPIPSDIKKDLNKTIVKSKLK